MKVEFKKIIIKMPNFIGDSIMTLPAIELVRQEYPNASISIVCKRNIVDIFQDKNIAEIIIDDTKENKKNRFKKTINLLFEIRKEKYDLGILFHNTFIDAFIFKLSKISTIIGYDKEHRKILLDFSLKIDRTRHYVNHYANLINQFCDNKYTKLPKMNLNSQISTLLPKNNNQNIAFNLGGENKDIRRYPKDLALKLFEFLKDEKFNILLLGDKEDKKNNDIYEEYLKKQKSKVYNFSGKTSLREYINLISSSDLLVTIDTSAMHISAAVGTKFLVLVGKGSSAFETVYPKVDFADFIFSGKDLIKDEDLIKAIKPIDIKNKILKIISGK